MANGFLLDTHAFLWWLSDDDLLSKRAKEAISDADNIFLSAASAWEIETKHRLGRLPAADLIVADWQGMLSVNSISRLDVTFDHSILAGQFQMEHRDPFDRMLAAQSKLERLPLITKDQALHSFELDIVW